MSPSTGPAHPVTLPGRRLPFDISYDSGGRATYRTDDAGNERYLHPGQVPSRYRTAAGIHLCALGDPVVQLRYATALRAMAARQARISAGTFLARIVADRRSVRQMLDVCDVFVCSASEATVLAGVGQLVDALAWLTRSVGGSGRA
ncbi:hypothetical protein [Salinispora arenicola]|uniref:hypothetical protein n=1 Tax=Salinispora arenicola TaxID=168697 RepID=UPI00039B08A2|nr:hypothetical protein [Salinispora arenicola]